MATNGLPSDQTPSGLWVDPNQGVWASLAVIDDVPVIAIAGQLDRSALEPCRAALDAALDLGRRRLVLDLTKVDWQAPDGSGLVRLMRRRAVSCGAAVTVADTPGALSAALGGGIRHEHGSVLRRRRRTGRAQAVCSASPGGALTVGG